MHTKGNPKPSFSTSPMFSIVFGFNENCWWLYTLRTEDGFLLSRTALPCKTRGSRAVSSDGKGTRMEVVCPAPAPWIQEDTSEECEYTVCFRGSRCLLRQ